MKRLFTEAATPKHLQAERAILEAIRGGQYPVGSRLPGHRMLAKSLGMAPMTVRNALQSLAQQGVLERRRRVGTFVRGNLPAPNIAFLLFNVSHVDEGTLPARTLEAIRSAAERDHCQVRMMLMLRPFPPLSQVCTELRAMNVGAVGMMGFLNRDREFIQGISEVFPTVLFNKALPGVALPCSTPDTATMARLMVDYFVARGRSRIGMGVFVTEHAAHLELLFAVQAEMARHGLPVDKRFWREMAAYDAANAEVEPWLNRMLDSDPRPDALILNTVTAAERLDALMRERGEEPGREMDFIPLHSGPDARSLGKPWPIMAYNDTDCVRAATQMLLDILGGKFEKGSAPVVRSQPELVMPLGERQRPGDAPAEVENASV